MNLEIKINTKAGIKMFLKKKFTCPYCNKILEKKPTRKTKCPVCEKYIIVRNQKLVTEEEANVIDSLKMFNFSNEQYIKSEKELTKKFGFIPKYHDVIWHICNEEITKNINNFEELSSIYFLMALFLNKRGKNHLQLLRQSHEMRLKYLKQIGEEEVEISSECCENCQKLKGRIFKIDEALEQMPLPNENCTNIRHDKKPFFCICYYWPTSEIVREFREKYR